MITAYTVYFKLYIPFKVNLGPRISLEWADIKIFRFQKTFIPLQIGLINAKI